jgi:predicted methyltransferase MtxX (methanogen marker protein 4)
MQGLLEQIRFHAGRQVLGRKPRIAIGAVKAESPRFQQTLAASTKWADLTLVGGYVSGYKSAVVSSDDARVAAEQLFALAKRGEVDAIVRGQIDYIVFHNKFRKAFPDLARDVMCVSLLRSSQSEWFMAPVVHHDDASVEGRCFLARQAARICTQLGSIPRIAILAADDPKGYAEQEERGLPIARIVTADFANAKAIEDVLRAENLDATVFALKIDEAITKCNIVVPMDGIVGNFLHRSLGYVGGIEMGGCFSLTRRIISIETSRFSDAFETAIEAACAMANLGGLDVVEYPGVAAFQSGIS